MKKSKKISMLGLLKKYWYAVILAPVFMLVEVYGDLMIPKLTAQVIDNGITPQNTEVVYQLGMQIIVLTFLMLIGGVACAIFANIAGQGFGLELRKKMYERIQTFSFENLNKFKTSSLITRLTNDVSTLEMVVRMSLRMMIRAPFMFLGGIVMAFTMNKELAKILIIALPLMIISVLFIGKKGIPFFNQVQKSIDKVNSIIRENLIGARVVKVFTREEHEKKRFEDANNNLMAVSIKGLNIMIWLMPVISLIMNLSITAVIWFGAKLVGVGDFEVGNISAFVEYIMQILSSFMMVSMIILQLSRSKVSYQRIREVLDEESNISNIALGKANKVKEGKIEFKDVCFAYGDSDGSNVLTDINLTINPGETIAVMGSTGSGKTTFVNLIPRMYDATKGDVLIDGKNVKEYDLEQLRRDIGMVLQKNILFSGTIRENICWGKENATDEEIKEACSIAQIDSFISNLPEKYNTRIGQRGVNFSGGQKQRLCIARALVKKPKILILDDSMSALDTSTENKLKRELQNKMKKMTKIIVAQRISTAKSADRIIVLDKTKISGIGTHEELLKTNDVYREIYNSQMEVND